MNVKSEADLSSLVSRRKYQNQQCLLLWYLARLMAGFH
jgi:hypothetical protein